MDASGENAFGWPWTLVACLPVKRGSPAFAPAGPRARVFSALHLLCIMCAGFMRIDPRVDIGVELSEGFEIAERLAQSQMPGL